MCSLILFAIDAVFIEWIRHTLFQEFIKLWRLREVASFEENLAKIDDFEEEKKTSREKGRMMILNNMEYP